MKQNFEYTKDDGEITKRVLYAASKPGNVSALDMSNVPDHLHEAAISTYDLWLNQHLKPYQKLERELKKANLKPLEELFAEAGFTKENTPLVKSFKPQGLKSIDE